MEFSEKFATIQKELKLSQKDFAYKLDLSPNAISQYLTRKRKPDINTIQKLIDIGVSPIFLFSNSRTPFDPTYDLFLEAKLGYEDKELDKVIKDYLTNKKVLSIIKTKIQRIKGQTFFEKFTNLMNGDGERMLILLYSFFSYLQNQNINIAENSLDIKFSELLNNFKVPTFKETKYIIEIRPADMEKLVIWAKNELDTISIIEIISSINELKSFIKKQLFILDKVAIDIVEKYFSKQI